jgi:CRISPR-associated protein Cas2
MKRLWVIAYDIADDRARLQTDRYLQTWGERVQYSVFEAFLTLAEARRILAHLQPLLDPTTDSLRLYPVCTWCERRLTIIGQGRRSSDPDVIVL